MRDEAAHLGRRALQCALALGLALAVGCSASAAADTSAAALQTQWLRVELDPASGAITGLAADPAAGSPASGGQDFSHPILSSGGAPAGTQPSYGIFAACRAADGQMLVAQPGEGFSVAVMQSTATVTGLRIGDSMSAEMQITVAGAPGAAPELTIRTLIRAQAETSCQWAGLALILDPALCPSTVYFADHQGVAAAGRITMPQAPYAGAICKGGAERSFVLTCSPAVGVEIEVDKGRVGIGLAPAIGGPATDSGPPRVESSGGEPIALHPGDTVAVQARLVFGLPQIAGIKPVTSKLLPQAQDFIFWTSLIATARPFGGPSTGSGPPLPGQGGPSRVESRGGGLAHETAAVIDPALPAETQQAYRRCRLRDIAHAWKSAMLVAGPDMLTIMRGEMQFFAARLDENGQPPTSIGPGADAAYGSLDSAGLLIGMIYDYVSRTGDVALLRELLPAADDMGEAITKLLGPHELPVIGEGVDTYPGGGLVKGEQTYLAAVCYDGLRKLAHLHEVVGEAEAAGKWHGAANRVVVAANRDTDRGGLWDRERGIYIGWRNPDGFLARRDEDSFANLWAIYSGLCNDGGRIRAIFARLNANWERYYLDGPCPTALSVSPYPNGLNQWAPWVGGWDVYVRTRLSEPRAEEVWRLLRADYERTDFPYREAGQQEPNVGNRGRVWDSWGLLQAIYAGHYGIEMAPAHLRILPRPLEPVRGDGVSGLRWRDGAYDVSLRGSGLHLARVTLDGRELASCLMPPAPGAHQVEITESTRARRAFVVNAGPMVALLGAEHRDHGIHVEAAVPVPGRYWMVIQWPEEWQAMTAQAVSGAELPQTARLEGDRAAFVFTVTRPGRMSATLASTPVLIGP